VVAVAGEGLAVTAATRDVAVVGGGPAGCAAGVFTARYGLDTLLFDRGRSSIARCAHLENYLGFPGGIDTETFYGLVHDHAEDAGCTLRDDLVESVDREGDGFAVTTTDGETVTARRVVAATRYDAEYLRGLDDDAAMFETFEYDGEEREQFDTDYPDHDGTTPVAGLYVASPSAESLQALVVAGRGARVGRRLVEDVRRERGYPEPVATHVDWMRSVAEQDDEWADRDRWREWYATRLPDDREPVPERREREIDRRLETYLTDDEIERRRERAHDRLLDHVDDERILAAARDIESRRGSEAGN
jgi:NADPH-dependent 2,4-dienoyl-CoA reductase/sulfur reductase-like enzyme